MLPYVYCASAHSVAEITISNALKCDILSFFADRYKVRFDDGGEISGHSSQTEAKVGRIEAWGQN